MCITSLELELMKTKSKYHMQCSTELGLKWLFRSLLESKWQERCRLIPLLKTAYVASCTAWEMLTYTQKHAREVDGQEPKDRKQLKACTLLECALRKYQDCLLLLPAVFTILKPNKTRGGKKTLSLTLRYRKRKINCSSLVGKFTKFSPPPSLGLSTVNEVLWCN